MQPADGNAELHAKRIAKRGKVQFAVPPISDEVCQLCAAKSSRVGPRGLHLINRD